jgi:hypothetical protein
MDILHQQSRFHPDDAKILLLEPQKIDDVHPQLQQSASREIAVSYLNCYAVTLCTHAHVVQQISSGEAPAIHSPEEELLLTMFPHAAATEIEEALVAACGCVNTAAFFLSELDYINRVDESASIITKASESCANEESTPSTVPQLKRNVSGAEAMLINAKKLREAEAPMAGENFLLRIVHFVEACRLRVGNLACSSLC